MSNVIAIESEPDELVIKELERLLEEARAGKIIEFDLVARYAEGCILAAGSGLVEDKYRMFGALTARALEYRDRHFD